MKRLIFVASVLALVSCSKPIQHGDIPFAKFEGVKGNVSEVTTSTYGAKMRRGELVIDENPYLAITRIYNRKGQIVEGINKGFDDDPELRHSEHSKFEYKWGRLVSIYNENEFGNNKYSVHSKVIEDGKNETIYEETSQGKTITRKDVYNGLIISMYRDDGILFQERTFNKAGILIGFKHYYNGDFLNSLTYELNENGEPISETSVYKDDDPRVYYYEYTSYDEKGNWLTRVEYDDMKYPHSVEVREIKYR